MHAQQNHNIITRARVVIITLFKTEKAHTDKMLRLIETVRVSCGDTPIFCNFNSVFFSCGASSSNSSTWWTTGKTWLKIDGMNLQIYFFFQCSERTVLFHVIDWTLCSVSKLWPDIRLAYLMLRQENMEIATNKVGDTALAFSSGAPLFRWQSEDHFCFLLSKLQRPRGRKTH